MYRVLRKAEQNIVLYLRKGMTFQNMNDLKNHTTDKKKKNQNKYCQERRRHHKTQQRVARSETSQTNIAFCSFFYNVVNLSIFGCAGSLLLCRLFLQLQRTGATLQLRCPGSSSPQLLLFWSREHRLQGPRALGSTDFSSCRSRALEHKLNSCGTWAYLPVGSSQIRDQTHVS